LRIHDDYQMISIRNISVVYAILAIVKKSLTKKSCVAKSRLGRLREESFKASFCSSANKTNASHTIRRSGPSSA
jgi:hypothetical protein